MMAVFVRKILKAKTKNQAIRSLSLSLSRYHTHTHPLKHTYMPFTNTQSQQAI